MTERRPSACRGVAADNGSASSRLCSCSCHAAGYGSFFESKQGLTGSSELLNFQHAGGSVETGCCHPCCKRNEASAMCQPAHTCTALLGKQKMRRHERAQSGRQGSRFDEGRSCAGGRYECAGHTQHACCITVIKSQGDCCCGCAP